jgi:hypothetical protein
VTGLRGLLLVAAALALAVPAHAQPAPAAGGPDEDLRCAAWAAVVLGVKKDDPDVAAGFGMALAWFVARYEGATGKRFEDALSAEYVDSLAPDLTTIEQSCLPRMQEMGQRFTEWGTKLQAGGQ